MDSNEITEQSPSGGVDAAGDLPVAEQRALLERFVLDNDELERLAELTGQFNVFEALGVVRQEIRHSNFLAWLLDPSQSHVLGDYFLKALLMMTSARARKLGIGTVSPVDVDVWDLSQTEVRREWKNIDITLLNEPNKFVCVIENKVYSSEHSDQLRRYREVAEAELSDYARHYVLLNVTGEEPSDSDFYVGVTYEDVCEVIDRASQMRASTIGPDVATALTHYVTMIRRRIMPDREIQELCRRIYNKHRAALDLIYEHRPDRPGEFGAALLAMIEADPALALDASRKDFVRFLPSSWKDKRELQRGQGWTKSGMILLFEFWNSSSFNRGSLGLTLMLGKGDEDVRRRIYDAAASAGPPFEADPKGLSKKWVGLLWKDIVRAPDYEELDFESAWSQVEKAWSKFKADELPAIISVIEKALS